LGIKSKKYKVGDLVTRISMTRTLLNKTYGITSPGSPPIDSSKLSSLGIVVGFSPINKKVFVHWFYDTNREYVKNTKRLEPVKIIKLVNRV